MKLDCHLNDTDTRINKLSESIAKVMNAPYQHQQISKRHNSCKNRSSGMLNLVFSYSYTESMQCIMCELIPMPCSFNHVEQHCGNHGPQGPTPLELPWL